METSIITFGAGSFWTTEAIFHEVRGVINVTSGYSGGIHKPWDNYSAWPHMDGCAEVVQVEYDPNIISLEKLVFIFMTTHDPTSLKQKGGYSGHSYRSIIFYGNLYEKAIIDLVVEEIQVKHTSPVITEIKRFERFYKAQESDQKFYQRNKKYGRYLQFVEVILKRFRALYPERLKSHIPLETRYKSA